MYEEALGKTGCNHQAKLKKRKYLELKQAHHGQVKSFRLNPPYSENVKTKVSSYFLNLTGKHFPSHREICKFSVKRNEKTSYLSTY